ncbi:MAG: T9SS type A sorting domain-containing protein [Bacteroidales bacterium]|nr:T9SS type A sorting domain-containing protein [Bacteroidales bacterium]
MKKTIAFIVLLLPPFLLVAQNYQCIRTDGQYFFTDGQIQKMAVIDSVSINNGTQIIYFRPTIADSLDNSGCFTRHGASWIGRRLIVNPEDESVFINQDNEPVTIITGAETGNTWKCYDFPNGNYILSTVEGIFPYEFLGIMDKVKKITFQAYDTSGVAISNQVNNKYLLLSQNYGLVRTLNFSLFPDKIANNINYNNVFCSEFELCGLNEAKNGVKNLTAADVYNFDIGDEIHTHYRLSYTEFDELNTYLQHHILDKSYSPQLDTVYYTVYKCGYKKKEYFDGNNNTWVITYTYYSYNSSIEYFLGPDPIIDLYPEGFTIDSIAWEEWMYTLNTQEYFSTTNRSFKRNYQAFWSYYPHDCLFPSYDYIEFDYFIEGLGGPFYEHPPDPYSTEEYHPVYYKKGVEEWGTPLNMTICDTTTSAEQSVTMYSPLAEIHPNPMNDQAIVTVHYPGEPVCSFRLFDMTGREVLNSEFPGNEWTFNRKHLPQGLYFYSIAINEKFIAGGKLMIQ